MNFGGNPVNQDVPAVISELSELIGRILDALERIVTIEPCENLAVGKPRQ